MRQMRPAELAQWLADPARDKPVVLDVREPWELATARLQGTVDIPMGSVPQRVAEIERDRPVVCLCHHGGRSMQVAMFLERQGFTDVINLAGGIDAWSREVDPSVPTY